MPGNGGVWGIMCRKEAFRPGRFGVGSITNQRCPTISLNSS